MITFYLDEGKAIGNERIGLVCFPPEFSGFKGDVLTNAGKVLKNYHGWQEVRYIEILSFSFSFKTIEKK